MKAGEVVYIGNSFWIVIKNTLYSVYYTDGRDAFYGHMAEVKQKYSFIDPSAVIYRLFQTTTLGNI